MNQKPVEHHPVVNKPVQRRPAVQQAVAAGQQQLSQREKELLREIEVKLDRNRRQQEQILLGLQQLNLRLEAEAYRAEIDEHYQQLAQEMSETIGWWGLLAGGLLGFELGSLGKRD